MKFNYDDNKVFLAFFATMLGLIFTALLCAIPNMFLNHATMRLQPEVMILLPVIIGLAISFASELIDFLSLGLYFFFFGLFGSMMLLNFQNISTNEILYSLITPIFMFIAIVCVPLPEPRRDIPN